LEFRDSITNVNIRQQTARSLQRDHDTCSYTPALRFKAVGLRIGRTREMDETTKNIDELVATRNQRVADLQSMGHKIASSATPIVVTFVDLAESTQMKQDRAPEDWLRYLSSSAG
jgi:hypothetical protein